MIDHKTREYVEFRSQVLRPLRRFAHRVRYHAVLSGVSALICVLVVAVFVHFAIDKLLVLGVGPRLVLLLLLAGGVMRLLHLWALRPLALRAGPAQVASVLENKFPLLRDRLVSAVSFAQETARPGARPGDEPSLAMIRSLMRDARERFGEIRPGDLIRSARLRRFMALALFAVVLMVSGGLYAPAIARTYVARDLFLQNVPWPTDISLRVQGFKDRTLRWPMGDDLTLVATAEERIPPGLGVEIERHDGASVIKEMDLRGPRQFVMDYGPLDGSLRLRFLIHRLGVDDATDWYVVNAVERPGIKDIHIRIGPPAYTQIPAFSLVAGQTSAEVLRGSSVAISATTNKPIESALLRCGNEDVVRGAVMSQRNITAEFIPTRGGSYHFDLLDVDQLNDLRPVTCTFQLLSDPPPKVRFALPGAGDAVVATAVLPLSVEAEDNLGIKAIDLIATPQHDPANNPSSQPATAHIEPLPDFTAHQTRYAVRHELPLMPYSVKPGDQITLTVEARDYQENSETGGRKSEQEKASAPSSLPTSIGRSPSFTLRIITPEELLAELGRRESEWRREFELVIKAQEQIKSRIMNLHDEKSPGAFSTEIAARYGQEERAQRQQSNRIKTIRRQFEQILAEMKVNQLDQPTVRRRLENNVIGPLGRLISTDMALAAELLAHLRMQSDAQTADQLESVQTRIVESMYAILAGMLKWEGYNEAVSLLRDIIRMQGDVSRQTQTQMEQEIERLFNDPTKEPKKDEPASQPES